MSEIEYAVKLGDSSSALFLLAPSASEAHAAIQDWMSGTQEGRWFTLFKRTVPSQEWEMIWFSIRDERYVLKLDEIEEIENAMVERWSEEALVLVNLEGGADPKQQELGQ